MIPRMAFSPTPADRTALLRSAAGIGAVAVVMAISQGTNVYTFFQGSRSWTFVTGVMLAAWLLMATTTPLIIRFAQRFSFGRGSRASSTLAHVGGGIAFSLVHLGLYSIIYMYTYAAPAVPPASVARFAVVFRLTFRYFFLQDFLAYGAAAGMCLVWYYSDLRTRLSDMRTRLAEARLTALRAQINPHFLFNTLNAISTLAIDGHRDEVSDMLARLGDLLRTTLDRNAQLIRLSEEMKFAGDYMAIQRVRFPDRLRLETNVADDCLDALVPSLVLQPLVENAVEHGAAAASRTCVVRISAARGGSTLRLEVSDTGVGFRNGESAAGIGLVNTRDRLQELYGANQSLEYGNGPEGGAVVRITLPFATDPRVALPAAADAGGHAEPAPDAVTCHA
jgi:two-component system LytT family sensor kinase